MSNMNNSHNVIIIKNIVKNLIVKRSNNYQKQGREMTGCREGRERTGCKERRKRT